MLDCVTGTTYLLLSLTSESVISDTNDHIMIVEHHDHTTKL